MAELTSQVRHNRQRKFTAGTVGIGASVTSLKHAQQPSFAKASEREDGAPARMKKRTGTFGCDRRSFAC
jgi:hypothetical protein